MKRNTLFNKKRRSETAERISSTDDVATFIASVKNVKTPKGMVNWRQVFYGVVIILVICFSHFFKKSYNRETVV